MHLCMCVYADHVPPQQHLDDMFHDLPLIEHIAQLVGQLRLKYNVSALL